MANSIISGVRVGCLLGELTAAELVNQSERTISTNARQSTANNIVTTANKKNTSIVERELVVESTVVAVAEHRDRGEAFETRVASVQSQRDLLAKSRRRLHVRVVVVRADLQHRADEFPQLPGRMEQRHHRFG